MQEWKHTAPEDKNQNDNLNNNMVKCLTLIPKIELYIKMSYKPTIAISKNIIAFKKMSNST